MSIPLEPPPTVRRVRLSRPGDPGYPAYLEHLADQLDANPNYYGSPHVAGRMRRDAALLSDGKFLYGDRQVFYGVVRATAHRAVEMLKPTADQPRLSPVELARASAQFGEALRRQKRNHTASRRPWAAYDQPWNRREHVSHGPPRSRPRERTLRRASRGLIRRPDDAEGGEPGPPRRMRRGWRR